MPGPEPGYLGKDYSYKKNGTMVDGGAKCVKVRICGCQHIVGIVGCLSDMVI